MFAREDTPGMIPRHAVLQPDPAPFWQPPNPALYGDITSVTHGLGDTLWVLYR